MMESLIEVSYVVDFLMLGGMGFVFGVVIPLAFRLIAYVVDGALLFTR